MTQAETILQEVKNTEAKRLAAVFIPLLLCYVCGGILAFLLAPAMGVGSCYVSCPIPSGSVYEILSSLALYLKSGVLQLFLIFLSVFTFFPSWVCAFTAIFRGLCTGFSLFPVSHGLLVSTGSPKAAVSLYFLSSVILLLLSAVSCTTADTLAKYRSRGDRRSAHALLFAYFPCFLVMSGGILVSSAFAVLFC